MAAMETRRALATLVGVSAIAMAGCGGSSHKTTSTTSLSASVATPPPSPNAVPPNAPAAVRAVAGRVLIAGDLPGLAPQGQRTLGTSAENWVSEEGLPGFERAKEVRRLTGLGFVRAVRERLAPASETGPEAISIVVQFRSARGARADLAAEAQMGEAHGAPPFPAPGIPGARGFGGANGATTGYNVAYAVGRYYYLVGVGYATGSPGAPSRASLVSAAQRLYSRVQRHG